MTDDSKTLIDYEKIVTNQLRAVIPKALEQVLLYNPKATETPPPHHFYITFRTRQADIPNYLMQQYPEQMTIVLQYQFWNLKVNDSHFSVTLSFGKTPLTITVPYQAITQFSDPAAQFTLKFDNPEDTPEPKNPEPMNDDDINQAMVAVFNKLDNKKLPTINGEKKTNRSEDSSPQPSATTKEIDKKSPQEDITDNLVSLEEFRKKTKNT